jgi:hypothetical protein
MKPVAPPVKPISAGKSILPEAGAVIGAPVPGLNLSRLGYLLAENPTPLASPQPLIWNPMRPESPRLDPSVFAASLSPPTARRPVPLPLVSSRTPVSAAVPISPHLPTTRAPPRTPAAAAIPTPAPPPSSSRSQPNLPLSPATPSAVSRTARLAATLLRPEPSAGSLLLTDTLHMDLASSGAWGTQSLGDFSVTARSTHIAGSVTYATVHVCVFVFVCVCLCVCVCVSN